MKFNREQLLEILTKLRPGLAKRETVEQATHFIFTGEEVVTFNDQICIHYPLKTDFEFSVKADEFHKIISTLPDKNIKLDLDKDVLKLKTQTTKAGLSIMVDESHQVTSLISILLDGMGEWKELPKNFTQGLFLCLFSASTDAQKGALVCISVDSRIIQSCDNYRASSFFTDDTIEIDPFLIHARDAAELVKFPGIDKHNITENWAHFKNKDGVMFSARKFWDDYVDISEIFDYKVDDVQEIKLPKALKEVVDSCAIMAKETERDADRYIKVSFKEGWITCFSQKSSGWIEKTLEVDYDGDPIEFNINPSFFSEILEKVTTMYYTGEPKVIFESDNFVHTLALNVATAAVMEEDGDIPF